MSTKIRRTVLALAASLMAVLALGTPAFAASGSVAPNSGITPLQLVKVNWAGMNANTTVFIELCNNKTAAEGFDPIADCKSRVSRASGFNSTGSGSTGTNSTTNKDYAVRSNEASADGTWACAGTGTDVTTVSNQQTGVTPVLYATCKIHVFTGSLGDGSPELYLPITFAGGTPSPVVPEAPYAVLLPLASIAVLGGAFLVLRNKRSIAA
jgi:hypothetical protein